MPKEIEVKSVLNKTKKRDEWFLDDYTVNLYSSCSFNCLYCYIRGSKYVENLTSSLSIKSNAIEILAKQLHNRAKKNQYGYIVLSSATDPYLRIDQELQLTRKALELIAMYRFPVHIITKSPHVTRDFDLLKRINQNAILPPELSNYPGVLVTFSFSGISDDVAHIFEPGAPPPSTRIQGVQKTLQAGFHTGISLMPLLPFITDKAEALGEAFTLFQQLGVNYVLPATLTLHGNDRFSSKTLVLKAVKQHFPELESRYLNYFENSQQMPRYYQEAFYKKMKELSIQYNIPNRITQNFAKK